MKTDLIKKIFLGLSAALLLTAGILMVVLKRPTYSDTEKRNLREIPEFSVKTLLSGEYFNDFEAYYNDTIPEREQIKKAGDRILNLKGFMVDEIVIYEPVSRHGNEENDAKNLSETDAPDSQTTEPTATPAQTETPEPTIVPTVEPTDAPTLRPGETPLPETATPVPTPLPTPSPTVVPTPTPTPLPTLVPTRPPIENADEAIEYSNEGSLFYKDRGLERYGGSPEAIATYVSCLERLKAKIPDLRVYSMTAPISSAFYMPKTLKSNSEEQKSHIELVESSFKNVAPVSVYGILEQRKNENIYLKTDHHWTYLGCYYAAQEFSRVAGVPFLDISNYTRTVRNGYVGSFYNYYKMTKILDYPEDFVVLRSPLEHHTRYYSNGDPNAFAREGSLYREDTPLSAMYSMIHYDDAYLSFTETKAGTGRKLLILHDSFGTPMGSFLMAGFDEIIMIDYRVCRVDIYDFIRQYGITDFLSVECIFSQSASESKARFNYIFY